MLSKEAAFKVVAAVETSKDFWSVLKTEEVDIVLLDIELPSSGGQDGFEIARQLKRDCPEVKILCVSRNTRSETLVEMLDSISVNGFLDKNNSSLGQLKLAIEMVMMDMVYTSPWLKNKMFALKGIQELSNTEYEIMKMLAMGKTAKEIANETFRSENTIRNHRQVVFSKLNCSNIAEATSMFMKHVFLHSEEMDSLPNFKRKHIESLHASSKK
jgi:DNA-binding NarL/FixJ family response regulator